MERILVVEDESSTSGLLRYGFEENGFSVMTASDGKEGLEAIRTFDPDLIVLDIGLPDMNGLEICKAVTGAGNTPVIIISAMDTTDDVLVGLEYGADDYITKPFDMREVIMRARSVLRRIEKTRECASPLGTLRSGDIEIDLDHRRVMKAGRPVVLTPKELDLLKMLMQNRGIAMPRKELLEKVWDFGSDVDTRTVDIHIQRLRKKLGCEKEIETVFGVGYKLV